MFIKQNSIQMCYDRLQKKKLCAIVALSLTEAVYADDQLSSHAPEVIKSPTTTTKKKKSYENVCSIYILISIIFYLLLFPTT